MIPPQLTDRTGSATAEPVYIAMAAFAGHVDSVGFSAHRQLACRYVAATQATASGEWHGVVGGSPVLFEPAVQAAAQSLADRFNRLKSEWQTATAFSSDVTEIAMHPAYQRIIGMGKPAIPLILRELEREPHHWFWALFALADADPVPETSRGDLIAMAAAWVAWGNSEGLL